jgi:hypothetical protein
MWYYHNMKRILRKMFRFIFKWICIAIGLAIVIYTPPPFDIIEVIVIWILYALVLKNDI